MIKSKISNFILSKVNIDKIKKVFGNTPGLNIIYKLGSQSLIDRTYPTHLFVETTRACNLACTCCPRVLQGAKGHMDYNIYKQIIDEASKYGVRNFCLHMLGEPLLHPQITDMVDYIKAKNSGHSILLTTNGSFLDERKARNLLENNVSKINVSVFSLKEDMNKKLVGKNDIERVIINIRRMVALKKELKSKTKLYMRMIASDENKSEIPDFEKLAKEIGITLDVRYTHNYSGVIDDNFTDKHKQEKLKSRHPCYHLWFSPTITWDGKIVICCNDWNYSEILGDIRKTTMAAVWQGKRMEELRNLHLRGEYDKIPVCAKCNVWSMYPDIFFDRQKMSRP